jgi:hypothetical protein
MPAEVGQPSAEQEQPAERERVPVGHPRHLPTSEPEVRPDGRQGDVHDRQVEHDDELHRADQCEDPALAAKLVGLHRTPKSMRTHWFAATVGT